jgi:hypothetical protein
LPYPKIAARFWNLLRKNGNHTGRQTTRPSQVDRPIKTITNNPFGLSLSKANIGGRQ